MKINEKYKIESDELNITLYKRLNSAKCLWQVVGYFTSLTTALKFLVDKEIKGTGLKDIQTVLSKISELEKVIEQLPKNIPPALLQGFSSPIASDSQGKLPAKRNKPLHSGKTVESQALPGLVVINR